MDTMAPLAPQMLVSNVIQLVNESDRPFNMEYAPGQRLQLAPNGQPNDRIFVNEEVAWYFLGRWWTDNTNPRNRMRADEFQRLRTLYGSYEDDVLWAQSMAHQLVAYAPDGQRILSVVDDPEGTQGGTQTQLGKEMSLESQVAVLQDTILAMQAQIAAQGQQNAADAQPSAPMDTTGSVAPTAGSPVQATVEIAGTQVPVAPAPFITPPAEDVDEPGAPARLPVRAQVVQPVDPGEVAVPEDAPPSIPHGESRMGGRIPAS